MPNTREKLIEVLDVIGSCNAEYCADCEFGSDIDGCVRRQKEIIADHLIANGVTVQQWIPVTERLPDDGVQVLACTKHGKPFPAHCRDGKWRVAHSVMVTNWMPLPEPPKGE